MSELPSLTIPGDRRRRQVLALGAALWLAASCFPKEEGTAPPGVADSPSVRLYVPNKARAPGAVLPVLVKAKGTGAVACIALHAEPGQVAFPFERACGVPTGAGGGMGGAAPEERTKRSCISLKNDEGALVGKYVPEDAEATVTLFGALYLNDNCSGDPASETFLVVSTTPEPEGNEGGAGPTPMGGSSGSGGTGGGASGGGGTSGGGTGGSSGAGGEGGSGGDAAGAGGAL